MFSIKYLDTKNAIMSDKGIIIKILYSSNVYTERENILSTLAEIKAFFISSIIPKTETNIPSIP
jgi:hypothetical protein